MRRVALLIIFLLCATPCASHASPESDARASLEELKRKVQEKLSKKEQEREQRKEAERQRREAAKQRESGLPTSVPVGPIVAHYRAPGGAQIAPITPTPVKLKGVPTKEMLRAKVLEDYEASKSVPAVEPKTPELKRLLRCTESQSTKEPFQIRAEKVPGEVLSDILILPAQEIPSDLTGVFGKNVEIYGYRDDKPNLAWSIAAGLEAPCLPFRERVLKSGVQKISGLEALKNYDDNARGVYHEYVKRAYKLKE